MTDSYLVGFWQTEKYFADPEVRQRLRRTFLQREQDILQSEAVRDFCTADRGYAVCQPAYQARRLSRTRNGGDLWRDLYRRLLSEAVRMIRERYPDAVFYIFSNDSQWVWDHMLEHMQGVRCVSVDSALIGSDAAELLLMSRCRHHILANSSFSWWGAWLSGHEPGQMTIAPDRWLNHKNG